MTKNLRIIFGPPKFKEMISSNIAPLEIIVKNSVRNLGVIIDSTLSFDNQIKSVVKSCFYQLRMISRLKPILSFKDLETVIHAFITSRLDYCNSLYVGICQRHLSRLQIVQNAAARLLTGMKKGIILLQYYLLFTGYQFSTGSILLMVFKALHNMSPSYITNLLEYHTSARTLRSADKLLLAVPRSQKKI